MKNKIWILIVLMGTVNLLSAQNTKVYFGFGGIYSSTQDTRFSDVQFNKFSVKPELGFTRISEKDYWLANSSGYVFTQDYPELDTAQVSTMSYNLRVGYLRNIKPNIYVGLTWDIIDYFSKDNSILGNSSNYYKTSSDIFVTGRYLYNIDDNWNFEAGLDFALLSFINTAPSFTANFPQNVVDDGEVSFLDSDTRNPYSLKHMKATPFWKQIYLRTHFEINYKKRLSLVYNWDMRALIEQKGYPVTIALHSLTLRFHFINHTKKTK